MAFEQIIKDNRIPLSKDMLKSDLSFLGIQEGDFLLVHTSLNQIGYVIGKEQTLIEALMEVVGETGLIVMPAHSTDNSNPENWKNPPVPESWFEDIKLNMPAYHKDKTPTRGIGSVPEIFRQYNGVVRSNHPNVSFAAYGNKKVDLISNHPYDYSLSDSSPLGLMYQWDFKILMLGTSYESCTAMHLSEYRSNCRKEIIQECAVSIDGKRQWIQYKDLDVDNEKFNDIGQLYEETYIVKKAEVGYADSRLVDFKSLINFTTNYLGK